MYSIFATVDYMFWKVSLLGPCHVIVIIANRISVFTLWHVKRTFCYLVVNDLFTVKLSSFISRLSMDDFVAIIDLDSHHLLHLYFSN